MYTYIYIYMYVYIYIYVYMIGGPEALGFSSLPTPNGMVWVPGKGIPYSNQ